MADAAKQFLPAKHKAAASVGAVTAVDMTRRVLAREPESKLWKKIQAGEFVVSVEIDPPKGISTERILEQVGHVMSDGRVDAIDINSGTLARVGMDALVLAGALEAHGYQTVPHLTSRDANIIGLQAMLLGAWAVGMVFYEGSPRRCSVEQAERIGAALRARAGRCMPTFTTTGSIACACMCRC